MGPRGYRAEPLFEISTDKVDAEIPAPAAGVVTEIRHKEGETVPVNTVVAVIGEVSATQAATPPTAPTQTPSPQADGTPPPQGRPEERPRPPSDVAGPATAGRPSEG